MKYLALIFCLLTPCLAWSDDRTELIYSYHAKQIKEIVTKGEIIAQMGAARNELLIEHKKTLWLCKFRSASGSEPFLMIDCVKGLRDQ